MKSGALSLVSFHPSKVHLVCLPPSVHHLLLYKYVSVKIIIWAFFFLHILDLYGFSSLWHYCCTLPVYSVFILMQTFGWALSFVRLKHLLCIQDVHCCCLPQTFTMWHLWCQICGSSQFLGPVSGCSSCLCVGRNLYIHVTLLRSSHRPTACVRIDSPC